MSTLFRSPAPEKKAASELARYLKEISGATFGVVSETDDCIAESPLVILIGCPDSNSRIAALREKGSIKLSADYPGLDGFIIKSLTEDGKDYLIIGSALGRGCLYGVYHYLEKYLKVGYRCT